MSIQNLTSSQSQLDQFMRLVTAAKKSSIGTTNIQTKPVVSAFKETLRTMPLTGSDPVFRSYGPKKTHSIPFTSGATATTGAAQSKRLVGNLFDAYA